MSVTNDTENLFESDAAYAARQRRALKLEAMIKSQKAQSTKSTTANVNSNNGELSNGQIISYLESSKILDSLPISSPNGKRYLVLATSSRSLRFLDLEKAGNGDKLVTSKLVVPNCHKAPISSICYWKDKGLLATGSWDKSINIYRCWNGVDNSAAPSLQSTIPNAHSDFVKCLLAVSGHGTLYLVSGGADKIIRVWRSASEESNSFSTCIAVIRGHSRPIEKLALVSVSAEKLCFLSAGSDRVLNLWSVSLLDGSYTCQEEIIVHETTIYALSVCSLSEYVPDANPLLIVTGSADKSVKLQVHFPEQKSFQVVGSIDFPDWVKTVCVINKNREEEEEGGISCPHDFILVVGLRNEEIQVFGVDLNVEKDRQQDVGGISVDCEYLGSCDAHADAISSLHTLRRKSSSGLGQNQFGFISTSLDGTVRFWSLLSTEESVSGSVGKFAFIGGGDVNGKVEDKVLVGDEAPITATEPADNDTRMMTAEEEAELLELMMEDE